MFACRVAFIANYGASPLLFKYDLSVAFNAFNRGPGDSIKLRRLARTDWIEGTREIANPSFRVVAKRSTGIYTGWNYSPAG